MWNYHPVAPGKLACIAPVYGRTLETKRENAVSVPTDCDEIGLSTDSAGPTLKPAMGEWGYMGWRNNSYKAPPVETRGLERARHVEATRRWLRMLRETEYYREPLQVAKQLSFAL